MSKKLTTIAAFDTTGDDLIARGGTLDQFGQAIESGVKVALLHGDRDFLCNCEPIDYHDKIISSILMLIT